MSYPYPNVLFFNVVFYVALGVLFFIPVFIGLKYASNDKYKNISFALIAIWLMCSWIFILDVAEWATFNIAVLLSKRFNFLFW